MITHPSAGNSPAWRRLCTFAVALAVAGWLGCGGGGTAPPPPDTSITTTTVSGVVTVAGKPLSGDGYVLILMADNGGSDLLALSGKGEFSGTVRTGTLKAGVLPQHDAEAAHGDPSKLTSPVTVTISEGAGAGLKIDLTTPPPALPKPGRPGPGGGGHSG